MLRSLSSRTTISELTDDSGEFSPSASAASSRQTSQVQQPPQLRRSNALNPYEDVARLGDAVYQQRQASAETTTSPLLSPTTAPSAASAAGAQWQFLPQPLWKQTAEVNKSLNSN